MSKQNEIRDFPQNSHRAIKVAIMDMGPSVAFKNY